MVVIAAVAAGVSIAHPGYDPHQNRAPAARIALAAIALVIALGVLRSVVATSGQPHVGWRSAAQVCFLGASLIFLVAWWIVTLSTGRL